MNLTPNPFTNRGMVTDPADFIGRAEQMEEICTRLHKMESTSIVGERRIGIVAALPSGANGCGGLRMAGIASST
ncbi:MAG: hypothetical protein ABI977_09515 [Acidobacteriota bacterium]